MRLGAGIDKSRNDKLIAAGETPNWGSSDVANKLGGTENASPSVDTTKQKQLLQRVARAIPSTAKRKSFAVAVPVAMCVSSRLRVRH